MVSTLAILAAATPAGAKPKVTQLTVAGPWPVGTAEAEALEAELAWFGARKRVEVTYEEYVGVVDLVERVTGPNPPDLIISPQPGTLEALAPELVDLGDYVKQRRLQRRFSNYMIDIVTVGDAVLGIPIKAELKSLVWYQPDAFAADGYQIPQTFAELVALSDQMVADGRTPWCNYIESGFATGWVGTDWIEDLLLGTDGPAVYDQWVAHSILFADQRVETAFERYQQMIDTPGYVFDRANMLNVFFFANAVPLGDGDCMMHKQASFFVAGIQDFGYDLDDFSTFEFPSVDPAYSDSAMGAGNYVAAVNDSKEVKRLIRFMASQRFGREALASSSTGWILPNVGFKTRWYTDELTRSHAETVQAALVTDQFRFDGSDLMPPEVGAGTFWSGIVDLVSGAKTIPNVLTDIDTSWPA
ncbi:MAG: carbohydrate ABC transporter substrate-binding protein [Actinomycetia bacterium]|nr:carbohydrate ABC transporter substrate-binding protein [Actinomycetes bacterium]